jgi:putative PIN family toxin of toxin-antitoxin system
MTRRSRKQERLLRWKVVLNTSALISAIGWAGAARDVVDLWKTGRIQVVLSDEIADEYVEVLERWVSESSLKHWRLWFSHPSKVTRVHSYARRLDVSRDVTDNKFVDVAVAGGVRYVITRDKDLLTVREFSGVRFVDPKDFLAAFRAASRS